MAPQRESPPKKKREFHHYPWWSPRFWHGMRVEHWLAAVARNGFRIHLAGMGLFTTVTTLTTGTSVAYPLQHLLHSKRIRETQLPEEPIFVIGHWRSGTTYLHELLALDERFTSPTTYECFAPNHCLLSDWFVTRFMGWLMPSQRPQDEVKAGWNKPQEDEFALCALGVPSPYLRMLFPADKPCYLEYLTLEDVRPEERQRWKAALDGFVRLITYRRNKRVVLKSPPHLGRVKVLHELYPNAKFIHIHRNPFDLFASTLRLWRSLDRVQGLQMGQWPDMEDFVFECHTRMYEAFERDRGLLAADQLCDVRYEEFVTAPVEQLRGIYKQLGLEEFEKVEGKLVEYTQGAKDFRPNQHQLDAETRRQIESRWSAYIDRYGYGAATTASSTGPSTSMASQGQ